MAGAVVKLPAAGRIQRRPSHPFYLFQRPFEITPMLLAPVLPGESLLNLQMQARAVSDPLNNPLQGWWLEYYFFYVKLRDLTPIVGDDYTQMHLEPAYDLSAHERASSHDRWRATPIGGQRFVDYCLTRVVETYFRDEGETALSHVISTGKPAAKLNGETWANSLKDSDDLDTAIDVDVSADMAVDSGGVVTDPLMASEIDKSMRHYEFLRANNLVEMDYEDYLKTFGIRTTKVEEYRPELIRYIRDWTYPTNTVDPTNGTPRSAVSWAIQERADKRRFFDEPGFVFGVSVARPKVYFLRQEGLVASFLDNAFAWLPALMSHDPATSLRLFPGAGGPVPNIADDYVADLRDLFIYGEQFVNTAMSAAVVNVTDGPAADNSVYPHPNSVDGYFVTVADGTSGTTKYRIKQDGIVNLTIAGMQRDTSPRGGNMTL